MKTIIFYMLTVLFITSCGSHLVIEPNLDSFAKTNIGMFADSTYNNESKFSDIFSFKLINTKKEIKNSSEKDAIDNYISLISNSKHNTFPIFEIKGTNKSIITLSGKGLWGPIWANVLIDRTSKKILKIQFGHKSETPGIGAKITDKDFSSQFADLLITYPRNQLNLLDSNGTAVKIDAIAGATITSNGVNIMIKKKLLMYKNYLR